VPLLASALKSNKKTFITRSRLARQIEAVCAASIDTFAVPVLPLRQIKALTVPRGTAVAGRMRHDDGLACRSRHALLKLLDDVTALF